MRLVFQAEASECGLAAMAMVSGVDLAELRRRFPLSLKGTKLNRLIRIAEELGHRARPLRLEIEDLDKLRVPCILHWDLTHYVVLARVGNKIATILDPARAVASVAQRSAWDRPRRADEAGPRGLRDH